MSEAADLLLGASLDRAAGVSLTCARTPSAVCDVLFRERCGDACDQWAILGRFAENHRSRDSWESACGVMVDLDFEDPAVPKDEGAHQVIPDRLRPRIADAMVLFPLPGFAYLTPRGLRWGCVFAEDVSDAAVYEDLALER